MRTSRWFTMVLAPSLCVSAVAAAQTGGTMPDHAGMQMAAPSGVTALLTSPLGTRSATGTATVDGGTVRVTWTGDQPGSTRAWYVHRGTCTRDEGMVGAASAYRPIVVDAAGAGTGTATLDVPLADGGAYYVAVHSSATDPRADVIACGSLRDESAGAQAGATSMAGMQHGSMQHGSAQPGNANSPSAATMDHSTMAMSASSGSGTTMQGMSGMRSADSASASLMAIHVRMMADPVIRERVKTDPVLQRMMAQMSAAGMTMTTEASGAAVDPHAGHAAPADRVTKDTPAARRASGAASTPARPTTRATNRSTGTATGSTRPARPATSAPAAPADPHAGHTMPAPAARPSQARPAPQRPTQQRPATPAPGDPHAGHTMPPRKP